MGYGVFGDLWVEVDPKSPFSVIRRGKISEFLKLLSLGDEDDYLVDQKVGDKAMFGAKEAVNKDRVGGIDLNCDNATFEIKGNGDMEGFFFDDNSIEGENIEIEGLLPVIVDVTPINDIMLFLAS